MNRIKRNFRLPRIWSNEVLREIAPLFSGKVINVSGWDDRDKEGRQYRNYFPNASDYYISNFAGERGIADAANVTDFNIDLSTPISKKLEGQFDIVFNHTTLEHIFEVDIAFQNLCRLSKDIVIVVVPFAQEIHFNSSYGDYWRFTPMGLRKLYEKNGLEVVFEAANHHVNAGIYLLFIGSKYPDNWRSKMIEWQPIEELGKWIGRLNGSPSFISKLKRSVSGIKKSANVEKQD